MRARSCYLLLVAALALAALQGQAPSSIPRSVPYFTPEEAPEILVYRIFFRVLATAQIVAQLPGGDKEPAAARLLSPVGLTPQEHQAVLAAASSAIEEMDENTRAMSEQIQELRQNPANAEAKARLSSATRARDAAISKGVEKLRKSLGPEKFERLDRLVRVHVTQNLSVYTLPPGLPPPRGGR